MTDAIPPLQKKLILVRGIPGHGKTTIAKDLSVHEVAADDMPGLYINGIYQSHLQKESHEWCKQVVEHWMLNNKLRIAVHNTFTKKIYIQPYLDLAAEHGYSVQIIHAEKIIFPDGTSPTSIHNVPDSVINSMQQGWENFTPIKKQGITMTDLHKQLNHLDHPDTILFDMDGTVKEAESGSPFPITPDDFNLTKYFSDWVLGLNNTEPPVHIISNQRGIETGQKTVDFLKHEIEILETFLSKNYYFYLDSFTCATHKNAGNSLIKQYNRDWASINYITAMDKPNTGMFDLILKTNLDNYKSIWIVGNSHTDESPDDWIFAQNCQQKYLELDIRYIPIEMLNFAWEIVEGIGC